MEEDILDMKELERQVNQLVDRTYVEEKLKIQLSEFEMLQSMFSNPGELTLDDRSVLSHFRNYLNGHTSVIPNHLDFSINLQIDSNKLQVSVNLPTKYPDFEPEVFVRSDGINRIQQGLINADLNKYISTLDRGDICIGSAIAWLQENALQYFNESHSSDDAETSVCNKSPNNMFTRFWIYSHHIYSKEKRREILEYADEYNLTGFCLPGKPGIICIEGHSSECEDWWFKIKSMNWKKIVLKKTEQADVDEGNAEGFRKFPDFREISFECKGKGKDFHMDFGEFFKYLSAHGCDYMFEEYFGIKGK